jgi:hypothetical protein
MPVITTKDGSFTLTAAPNMTPPSPDDTGVQYGARFDIEFAPTKKNKIGLIQLIWPQKDVGSYKENKTDSGWAMDKNKDAALTASSETYKLTFGITGDQLRPGLQHRFGDNGSSARTFDAPQEILGLTSNAIVDQLPTKFVHYVAVLSLNKIFDEGVEWGYSCNGNIVTIHDPKIARLSKNASHRAAMAKFLKLANSSTEVSTLIV